MKTRRPMALLVLTLAVSGCRAEAAPVLEPALSEAIARLDAKLSALPASPLPEQMKGGLGDTKTRLDAARKAADPWLRLYRLRGPFVEIETLDFVARHAEAASDLGLLSEVWASRRGRFGAVEAAADRPALLRALEEGARNKAEKLYPASLPYGKVSSPLSGLYYLGEAEGHLAFARFAASLDAAASKGEPAFDDARLAQSLEALERETVAAFEKEPTAQTMIPVSARLKEAREMLGEGRIHGAALALLESRDELTRRSNLELPAAASSPESRTGETLLHLWTVIAREEPPRAPSIQSSVVPLYESFVRRRS